MRTHTRLIFACLAATIAFGAAAAELKGVSMPDKVEVSGKPLLLNGQGVRLATIFKVSVYVAGLYLPSPNHDASAIIASNDLKMAEMEFVRDVGSKDIHEIWTESFHKNCGSSCAALESKFVTFLGWLDGMKKGDRQRYTFFPDHMEYTFNGQLKGKIDGGEFGKVVLSVWLGPNPPNKELKQGLLGQSK